MDHFELLPWFRHQRNSSPFSLTAGSTEGAGGHHDVEIAVAVEVGRRAVARPAKQVDDVPPPGPGGGAAVVFVPEDDPRRADRAEQVRTAIAVEVAGPDRARLGLI